LIKPDPIGGSCRFRAPSHDAIGLEVQGGTMLRPLVRLALLMVAVLAGLLLATPIRAEDAPQELRFRFTKGEKIHFSVRHRMQMEVEFAAASEDVASVANSIRHFQVIDVDAEGNATLEIVNDRAFMTARKSGEIATYDSTRPEEEVPPQFAMVAAMIGRPWVQIKVSPLGAVLGITSLQGDAVENAKVAEQQFEVLFALPKEPVAVGKEWRETLDVEVTVPPGPLKQIVKLQRRYQLDELKDGMATISVKTIPISAGIDSQKEGQLIHKLWDGQIVFDVAQGRMVRRVQKINKEVAGFSEGQGLLKVKSIKTDEFTPVDKLAEIDLKTIIR
jgi:hypothetical protein